MDNLGVGVPVSVYSAADDLQEFRHIKGEGGSATNETYKWAEEAARPEGGLHQQPSTNTYFFGDSNNFLLSASN